ncbi:MAG: rhomboid family intramembrane serine protease [Saprospiraceae bacterium]|nr:rhomboid family intramembrane serine protease [Saprospiraceae bacterium]MCB9326695.1 rhomboid family intramembrane serine protease [Lewinellaceae bacterium]
MIFPIGDDQVRNGHFPYLSYGFIALNVLIYIWQSSMPYEVYDQFIYHYGAIPGEITQGVDLYTLLTSAFLHASWMHLIGNMVFLWVFADNIEATIGSRRFLVFYLIGILAAHAGHIYFNWYSNIPTVGASGAIAAVMGAYLVMYPKSRIRTLVFFFFIRIPAFLFLGFWIIQQSYSGVQNLSNMSGSGVAWWAHIGGFAFGALAGLFFRRMIPEVEPVEDYA